MKNRSVSSLARRFPQRVWRWVRANGDIVAIFLVAVLVRCIAFGSVPPGLNQDEASSAYDAWALLHYGIDRNGFAFPVMLVSWGSGMHALSGYMAWPFLLLFGLSSVSARLPHLAFGLLTLVVFYLTVLRLTERRTAVIALFLLAINPWHVMICRWALESNVLPGFLLLSVYFLLRATERPVFLYLSAAFFALCLYAYGTAYILVPGILLLSVCPLLFFWKTPGKTLLGAAAVCALVALPVVLYVCINQFDWPSLRLPFLSIPNLTGAPRFQMVSSLFGDHPFADAVSNLRTFSRMLIAQDDGQIWNAIPGIGLFPVFGLPFACIGIFAALHRVIAAKGKDPVIFLFFWLFMTVVLAALQSVNVNRINAVFLPFVFFGAVGVSTVVHRNKTVLGGLTAIFVGSFASFVFAYFGDYRSSASGPFFEGLTEAITMASGATTGPVCVTGHVNMPYVFALFAAKTDPNVFLRTVRYENPGAAFQGVLSFDRYTFGMENCAGSYGAYVVEPSERSSLPSGIRILHSTDRYLVAVSPS